VALAFLGELDARGGVVVAVATVFPPAVEAPQVAQHGVGLAGVALGGDTVDQALDNGRGDLAGSEIAERADLGGLVE
jgi:hypothetical protein